MPLDSFRHFRDTLRRFVVGSDSILKTQPFIQFIVKFQASLPGAVLIEHRAEKYMSCVIDIHAKSRSCVAK